MALITKIGVVGAGNMGSGIAQKIATEDLDVVMVDLNQDALDRGLGTIKTLLSQAVERKIFNEKRVEKILSRLKTSTKFEDLKDCDIVIEAIFEDLQVKKDLFSKLDGICDAKTILASNTSSFYVKDLSSATKRADRVVGLHYFFHPAKNRLVEVIPDESTSEETRSLAWKFNEIIGKTPIHSADAPGFVVNRFFVPWLNEAVRLLEEGVADIPTIEEASKQAFKIGMGPFELMNVTGVPIAMHAANTLGKELGDFYAPSKKLCEQVDSKENWILEGEPDSSKFETVTDRLLGVTFQVAGALVDEKVATIEDTDIGARVGLRWIMGPYELMNRFGLAKTKEVTQKLCDRYGLAMPQVISNQGDKAFQFCYVRNSLKGSVATISFNRPDAMNALNEEVMNQLRETFDRVEKNPDVNTIVLEGTGKAFVAGADIRYFVKKIKSQKIPDIENFTKFGQALYRDIDNSSKLVIIKLDGLSLGGGSELVLCADVVVATPKGVIGFPETGIGIYPGLGGTQRLSRAVGKGLSKWLVFSGDMLSARDAHELGLVQEIAELSDIDSVIDKIAADPASYKKVSKADAVPEAYQGVAKLFAENQAESFLNKTSQGSEDEKLAKIAKRVSFKAPIALKTAERLIDEGLEKSLDEGLQLELDSLNMIFSTEDALEGLSSLGRKRPEWVGK